MVKASRRDLYRELRYLPKPKGITPRQWLGVKKLLEVIIDHYPHPCPSQQRIAERVGCDVSSIRRYTRLAESAGLLVVHPDQGMRKAGGVSYTHSYDIILSGSEALRLSAEVTPILTYGSTPRSSSKTRGTTTEENPAPAAPARKEEMAYADELGRANAKGYVPVPKPGSVRGAHGIVAYFDEQWWKRVVYAYPHMRVIRVMESVPAAVSYVRTNFKHRSGAEVREIIDEFMDTALRESAGIKPGQSAWLRFTGWWGRQATKVDAAASFEQWRAERDAHRDTEL